jgi:predicted sugar kinase
MPQTKYAVDDDPEYEKPYCNFKISGTTVLRLEKTKFFKQGGMAQVYLMKNVQEPNAPPLVMRKIVSNEERILLIIEAVERFLNTNHDNIAQISNIFLFKAMECTLYVIMVNS